jgi:hypothetical protein
MSARKGWLEKFLQPERAARRPAGEFSAYRLSGSIMLQEPIRNISASGAYLVTDKQLLPGSRLSFTMQNDGPFEFNPAHRITTFARVVRVGSDGVGIAFEPPNDAHSRRWADLVEFCAREVKPREMYPFLQLAAAVHFIARICPRASDEIDHLFRTRLSNYKMQRALDIALKAETLLSYEPDVDSLRADPRTVLRILENGASAEDDWLQGPWAGLLAVSCSSQAKVDAYAAIVEMFGRLTPTQIRILDTVCTKSIKVRSDDGGIVAQPLTCELDEFLTLTGARDSQIDQDIRLMSELALLEMSKPSILTTGSNDLTATPVSLLLHASYSGHRGNVEDYYSV